MAKKRLRAIMFGPPGSGKGTQGQLLADRFDVPHVSTGELFRAEIAGKSAQGKMLKKYVEAGALVPDELTNAVVTNQLKRMDLRKGFVLDGYPRNVEQATHLNRVVKINIAVQLRVADVEAVRRLVGRVQCVDCEQVYHKTDSPPIKPGMCALCGGNLIKRNDDTKNLIRKRLETFHFMTEPLVSYYRQKGVLLTINGEQAIPYVFEEIMKKTAKLGFKS
ncbi:MAG: nucleoside monophosphate kinase [Patescibacteria group bacterium]|nr:nucleoside monophosphate kinase [Patescibacteria group bacterium]MBU2509132.1 nucleoside monophosphate kinase [Patescibacteria group bacterium]